MTTSRIPAAFALALGAVVLLGSSCTAILAPRDDVQRCSTAEDCDPTGDNRYVPDCRFDDANLDLDSSQVDKICVAEFKSSVGCDPLAIANPEQLYRATFDELADPARYTSCDMSQGAQGCPPMAGGACLTGLELDEVTGLCDDTSGSTPTAYRADTTELIGQDVRDQFCKSFFCDPRFVCDTGTNFCVICDDEEPLGEGGCGQIYIGGAPSCVYNDGNACQGSDVSPDTVTFGDCGQ